MYKESLPIAYDAPADLKKWPSLNSERRTDRAPYLVYSGTLADCIRELLAKPIRQTSLCDIVTEPQAIFRDLPVLSPADAAEIAMRWDLPKDWAVNFFRPPSRQFPSRANPRSRRRHSRPRPAPRRCGR